MSDLDLTLAISHYDHVADLTRGRIAPEGIRLRSLDLTVEEIFQRFVRFQEWDVSEMSMGKYVALTAAGESSMVGLPVFPSRVFRHSAIYVREGAVGEPRELAGARIGVPEWAQTAVVYMRALLTHEWGVDLSEVSWIQAGVNEPGRRERVQVTLPAGVELTRIGDRSLNEMLLSGDLDAIFSAHAPTSFLSGDPRVRRLFPSFAAIEEEYGRRTGVIPIMHLVVVRREIADAQPWVLPSLQRAFEKARTAALVRLARPPGGPGSHVPLLWIADELQRTREVFGGEPWPYGVEANRTTLDAFCRWCHEQGVTRRPVEVDELFPASLSFTSRV